MVSNHSDRQLVQKIREGDAGAWQQCIDLFEGRLLAFVRSRLTDRTSAEDVVQETFLGFLKALPNYDETTPLESWLFSIASHKLIDAMRRTGRRPTVPLITSDSRSRAAGEPAADQRAASSLFRSHEKSVAEATVVETCLRELIASFKRERCWERLQCVELIFVLGWANKDVARRLNITEQAVANHKFFVVGKLKDAARKSRLRNFQLEDLGLDDSAD
ncbi:MAG: sigma-70 family RNA polymerase sigma factor [Planctomycetaceae bacterium]